MVRSTLFCKFVEYRIITNKIVINMNVLSGLCGSARRFPQKRILLFLALMSVAWALSAQVTLKIDPASQNAEIGDQFSMDIIVEAGDQLVDAVEIHLDFDPSVLQVVSLTKGTLLPVPLIEATFDNTAGTIDYAGGTFSNFPSGTFTHLTMVFEVVGASPASPIVFTDQFPRQTIITFGGNDVLDDAIGAEVIVPTDDPEANFSGSLTLVGDCTNPDLIVSIYEAGTSNLVRTQNVSGTEFDVLGLDPTLTYDIFVKAPNYLQSKLESVQLQPLPANNALDFGQQVPGDVNDDNQVTGEDYVLLKNSYDLSVEDPGFNEMADFNCDNFISGEDYVFLKVNYNKIGEQP